MTAAKLKFALRPTASVTTEPEYDYTYTRGRTIGYEVQGMPIGEVAHIADHGWRDRWRIFHERGGARVVWPNGFETAQAALQALEEYPR